MSAITPLCGELMRCQVCPKSVDNAIIYATHPKGFHQSARKSEENTLIFLLKGEMLVNSKEYAGVLLRTGEFILQAVDSKYELLGMTDVEYVSFSFNKPELLCEERYQHIVNHVTPPLIYSPLKMVPELFYFLAMGAKGYLSGERICRELLLFKRKELAFILACYYSDYELSMLVHSLSKYTTSFEYFVLENHTRAKTVEELAKKGGYTVTTFRRIFNAVFHKPVYEWMQDQRKTGIVYDLCHTNATISEVCYKYGFESLPHFSNFCKKNFGLSPRNLRQKKIPADMSARDFPAINQTQTVLSLSV